MKNEKNRATAQMNSPKIRRAFLPVIFGNQRRMMSIVLLLAITGCETPPPLAKAIPGQGGASAAVIGLREGDVLSITFPGAANLNTTQQIQRDGNIALPLIGELKVAGMTPGDIEKELVRRYASQLVSKEVTVTVVAASFPVYVTGSVLHPGKILSNRPISALEAIMEAGGINHATANLKAVAVIRYEGERAKHYTLNLKDVLRGEAGEPFYLKPSDIVYVPEKFSWF